MEPLNKLRSSRFWILAIALFISLTCLALNNCFGLTPGDEINLTGISGPYSFHRFCRLDTGELWAVGGNGTVQYTDSNGTIEKQITDKSLNGVYFINSFAGWVVGDAGTILHTRNRGADWQIERSSVMEDLCGITCHDENRCWVVGRKGLILRTVDQGVHWRVLTSGTSAILFAITFVDDRSGWAVGEDGSIVHTSDAGETWEKQRAIILLFPHGPYSAPTDLLSVIFLDDKRGWVAGSGGVATTKDGGKTWIAKEIEGASFVGVVSHDGKTVWAIDRGGNNYLTKNGGQVWESVKPEKASLKRNAHR